MIEPVAFGRNPDSARTNAFMRDASGQRPEELQATALHEFQGLVERLENAGVEVLVFRDSVDAPSPDAIFPNNWVSFHEDGRAILYPMEPPNRRPERRKEIRLAFGRKASSERSRRSEPSRGRGSIPRRHGQQVFDRPRTVYACLPAHHAEPPPEYAARFGSMFRPYAGRRRSDLPHQRCSRPREQVAVFCGEAVRTTPDERQERSRTEARGGRITMERSTRSRATCSPENAIERPDRDVRRVLVAEPAQLQNLGDTRLVTSAIRLSRTAKQRTRMLASVPSSLRIYAFAARLRYA
jgi:hypothetical protein